MATATVSGSTVVFSNSGAAANLTDSSLNEDSASLALTFDVLAASGGGKNTTLWSVDDGISGDDNAPVTVTNKAFAGYDTDLLYQDAATATWQTNGDTSAQGAHVWIGSDNKIHYDASNISTLINTYGAGQTFTDTVEYTIRMSNGTLSVGTLTINIAGRNDAATITWSASEDTSVTEAGGVNNSTLGDASASGTLTVNDVDMGQNHFQTPASLAGSFGTYTFNTSTGAWTYTLDQSLADSIPGGETRHDHLVVTSADGTATYDIDVTVNGANDSATITASASEDATVTEAGGIANATAGDPSASGTLTVHDVDNGENHFQTPASLAGSFGTYTFNTSTGAWTYTLDQSLADSIAGGDTRHDHLIVKSADGTATRDIDVTINGSNDAPVAVADTGSAGENETKSFNVLANDTDVDAGTTKSMTSLGTITVTSANGTVNGIDASSAFTIDAGQIKFTPGTLFDPLTASDSATVTVNYTMQDEHGATSSSTLTLTVNGANDTATITVSASEDNNVTEAGGVANGTAGDPSASGTLTVHDVDNGENHFDTPASLVGSFGTYTFNTSTGAWTYTLDQSLADSIPGGETRHDHLIVSSADGTASHDIDVTITGSNDSATITVSASEDNAVTEAGGVANGTAGDPSASGTLTVHDVDNGENHFDTPASLAGSFGTYTFNTSTGAWTYTLDQSLSDSIPGGETRHDHLVVSSADGTATHDIDVTITGSNDSATITASVSEDTSVVEAGGIANGTAGDPSASGTLTVHDVDNGENHFDTPASLAGSFGTYTFNTSTGAWTYTLDQSLSDSIPGGETRHDHLIVSSADGTATHDIDVTITGANDSASITVSASEDNNVTEAGGVANGTAGDPSASGTLTVHDVDNGENHFQTPSSLAGSFGTYTFNTSTGAWTYTLDQSLSDSIPGGETRHDHLVVSSADGTATHDIDVTITGSNDSATITVSASEDNSVTEAGGVANGTAGDPSASGTLTVHDVDNGENHFQTPSSLAGTFGTYTFNTSTGAWTYTLDQSLADSIPGGETRHDHLVVSSADGTASHDIDVTITGSDDAPVVTSGTTATVAENVATSTTVYTATATDVDAGDSVSWSLTGDDAALFNIDSSGHVTFKASPDFEHPQDAGGDNVYNINVVATDGGSLTDSKGVAITVTDVNDNAPVITTLAAQSVNENTAFSVALTSTDADTVGTNPATFSITGGADSALFSIDGTGHLTMTAKDFENAADADHNNTYVVQVTANDGANTTDKTITVTVNDQNDNAPVITTLASQSVNENAAFSVALTSTDADTVGTNPATFSITGGADAGLFSIDGTGHLTMTAKDFENPADADHNNTYVVQVTANDGVNNTNKTITVTVGDVNEAPTAVVLSNTVTSTAENGGDVKVADISVTDDALGANTLYLTGADAASFSLVGNTLHFVGGADFETKTSYSVTVNVNDATVGGNPDASQAFTLAITNVNEAPTITSGATASTPENVSTPAAVYTATATDPDAGTTLTYSISGTDSGLFNINSSTGAVTFKASPNFEAPADAGADNVYNFTVTASDGSLSDSKNVALTVTDVNEAPTAVVLSNTVTSTAENGGDIKVADISITDDALGTNQLYLTGADAAAFSLVGNTLHFVGGADFETKTSYSVTVNVNDATVGGNPDASQAFTLAITNVNEAPHITSGATGTEPENSPISNVVYHATATDPDVGDTIAWSLAGTDAGFFNIDSSGNVTFKASPDFENPQDAGHDNIYDFSVVATDSGSLTDSKAVAITVTDVVESVNHAPTGLTFVPTDNNGTGVLGNFVATDPDANALSYSFSSPTSGFIVDATTGALTLPTINGGTTLQTTLTITASDGSLSTSQTYNIWIGQNNSGDTQTLLSTNPNIADGLGGADSITGSSGTDYIFGGSSADTITGGGGADWLIGGNASDTFKYTAVSDSTPAAHDTIVGFTNASQGDIIDVSAIDANTAVGGDQAFNTGGANIGSTALANGVWATISGSDTILHFDTNGNTGTDEMQIVLQNFTGTLHATDFNL